MKLSCVRDPYLVSNIALYLNMISDFAVAVEYLYADTACYTCTDITDAGCADKFDLDWATSCSNPGYIEDGGCHKRKVRMKIAGYWTASGKLWVI